MCFFPNFRLGPIDGSNCDSLGIDNKPLANFRWNIEDSTEILKVTFPDLSAYLPTSWHWDFGDGQVSQDTSPIHTYSQFGVYNVCQTVTNANGADTLCRLLYLGVTDTENLLYKKPEILISPNPFNSIVSVTLSESNPKETCMVIYDLIGHQLGYKCWNANYFEWDLKHLPSGIFVYQINNGTELVKTGKLVKN
jgi:PKD repeat protein